MTKEKRVAIYVRVMTSSLQYEGQITSTGEYRGIFTWAVLDALRNGDEDNDGFIELSEKWRSSIFSASSPNLNNACSRWGELMCSQAAGSSRVGQEPSDTEPVKRQDRREVGAPESVVRHDGGGKHDACAIFAHR
jgi:hypothetical protein